MLSSDLVKVIKNITVLWATQGSAGLDIHDVSGNVIARITFRSSGQVEYQYNPES